MWLLIIVFLCLRYKNDVEVRKGSEDKEKDEEDLNLTSDAEVNTMISDNAELVEMSTEIAVKEEAGESKDADVIKTENSSVMQE